MAINNSNSSVDLGPISVEDVCVVVGDACPKHACLLCALPLLEAVMYDVLAVVL